MSNLKEPTDKDLAKIERELDRGVFYDEDFDEFSILEEDFTLPHDDDWTHEGW